MARRARKNRAGALNRPLIALITLVFFVGIFIGFLFGKKSLEVPKAVVPPKKIEKKVSVEPPDKKKFPHLSVFGIFKKPPPRIAIVIDDVGNDAHLVELVWSLPAPVTLAILPGLPYSEYFAREGRKRGYEIILHQPMEPLHSLKREDVGMIRVSMSDEEIAAVLNNNLGSIPHAMGLNNHMGSFATQDSRVMRVVMGELKKRDLFFLDSLTSSASVGRREARQAKVRFLARDVFLDNESDPNYVLGQLDQLVGLARKNRSAVGIGHYKWSTLTVLKQEIARLTSEGYQIVPLKELL